MSDHLEEIHPQILKLRSDIEKVCNAFFKETVEVCEGCASIAAIDALMQFAVCILATSPVNSKLAYLMFANQSYDAIMESQNAPTIN